MITPVVASVLLLFTLIILPLACSFTITPPTTHHVNRGCNSNSPTSKHGMSNTNTASWLGVGESILSSSKAKSPQLLSFQEPKTNTTVILVGAMHYNPTSIKLAQNIVQQTALKNELKSVVIECCDLRWNKIKKSYTEKPYIKKILSNEMYAATKMAMEYNVPVILGDQRINITTDAIKDTLKESIVDLLTPPMGWMRFGKAVSETWNEVFPFTNTTIDRTDDDKDGTAYLNASAFLDPRLLILLPVTLVKYPLSFLVRDPIRTSIFFTFLLGLTSLTNANDPVTMEALMNAEVPISDLFTSLFFALLETIVFVRLLVKPLLADRNEVLARNILKQCEVYSTTTGGKDTGKDDDASFSWYNIFKWKEEAPDSSDDNDEEEVLYAYDGNSFEGIATTAATSMADETNNRVVIAILGMAHCNGIKKLLKEQLV